MTIYNVRVLHFSSVHFVSTWSSSTILQKLNLQNQVITTRLHYTIMVRWTLEIIHVMEFGWGYRCWFSVSTIVTNRL